MKKRFCAIALLLFNIIAGAQDIKIDTLYYDGNLKSAIHKSFSNYYVIVPNIETESALPFKAFYSTGELYSEGSCYGVNSSNFNETIFDGDIVCYYRNGSKKSSATWKEKKIDGAIEEFNEKGECIRRVNYHDGLLSGEVMTTLEDGMKIETYNNGNPVGEYYIIYKNNGTSDRFTYADDKLYQDIPSLKDMVLEETKDHRYRYYTMNGISIVTTIYSISAWDGPGNFYEVNAVIQNNTTRDIYFNPDNITAYCTGSVPGEKRELMVLSKEQYTKRLKLAADIEGAAAAISRATTALVDPKAAADVVYDTKVNNIGNQLNFTTTITYNDHQAKMDAINRKYAYELLSVSGNYFEQVVIKPGQQIYGHFIIQRRSGSTYFSIPLDGQSYMFSIIK